MPLRRARNTFRRHSDEDAVMSDATTSAVEIPDLSVPLAPSRSVNGSTSLGKRRRGLQGQSPERASKRIAAMRLSMVTPELSTREISTPVVSPTHTSIPDTSPSPASKRPNLSLYPNNNTSSTGIPNPTFPISHSPEPASPAATEIACDVSHVEQPPDEHMETLRAAGIKVRDFAFEPMPNSIKKAPEIFDPVPPLIAADWHMRNPRKNKGLLSPKALFRLIKMKWLSLEDVELYFNAYAYVALAHYNDKPDDQRYPFVAISRNESMPTPSQRVRLRRQAGLPSYPEDRQDKVFFGYNPTGYSDDEGEGEGDPPAPRAPTPGPPVHAEMAFASASDAVEAELVEAVVVEEPKPRRRQAKGTTKTRSRAKVKSLRRECSRPEV